MNAAHFKNNKGRKLGKYLLIAAVTGAVIIIILISTGILTWRDLVEIHFQQSIVFFRPPAPGCCAHVQQ